MGSQEYERNMEHLEVLLRDNVVPTVLNEKLESESYIWSKLEKIGGWNGKPIEHKLIVRAPSSLKYNGLVPQEDIVKGKYVDAILPGASMMTGSLSFWDRELNKYRDKKAAFIDVYTQQLDFFNEHIKQQINTFLFNGEVLDFTKKVGNGDGKKGILTVTNPKRFQNGQKIFISRKGTEGRYTELAKGFINSIDFDNNKLQMVQNLDIETVVDVSGIGDDDIIHIDGGLDNGFENLRKALLPVSVGGNAKINSLSKSEHYFMNPFTYDASAMDLSKRNLLTILFDIVRKKYTHSKGQIDEIICGDKLYSAINFCINVDKMGATRYRSEEKVFDAFNVSQLTITDVEGRKVIVTVDRDLRDDIAYVMNWKAIEFRYYQLFERMKGQNGEEFYRIRGKDDYVNIVDILTEGNLHIREPNKMGIIYNIPVSKLEITQQDILEGPYEVKMLTKIGELINKVGVRA
ncbi:MAG: hypothetical protein HQK52_19690 [Oligoflexia bacterium]|nr:hypothetical protein [Oligoflexia bacterium]